MRANEYLKKTIIFFFLYTIMKIGIKKRIALIDEQ